MPFLRRLLAAVAVVAVIALTLGVGRAAAQGAPLPPPPAESTADLQDGAKPSLIPDPQYPGGNGVSLWNYDVGWDSGEPGKVGWGPFKVKVGFAFSPVGLVTAYIFSTNIASLAVAFRITQLALNFGLADILAAPVDAVSKALSFSILGGWLQLRHIVIIATCIVCLRRARNGMAVAGSALITALMMMVAAGALLVSPGAVYQQAVLLSQGASMAIMDSVANHQPQPGERLGDTYWAAMQNTLIEQPYYRLQWGSVPPEGPCLEAGRSVLKDGLGGTDDEPRKRMVAAGCPNRAEYNAHASWARLSGTWALTLIVQPIAWGLIVFDLAIMITMVALAVVVAVGPIALTLAAVPGKFRAIGAVWLGAFGGRVLKVVVLTAIVGGFLSAIGAVASTPDDRITPGARWLYMLAIVAAFAVLVWKARKLQDIVTNLVMPNPQSVPVGRVVVRAANAGRDSRDALRIAAGAPQTTQAGAPLHAPVSRTSAARRAATAWARVAAGR